MGYWGYPWVANESGRDGCCTTESKKAGFCSWGTRNRPVIGRAKQMSSIRSASNVSGLCLLVQNCVKLWDHESSLTRMAPSPLLSGCDIEPSACITPFQVKSSPRLPAFCSTSFMTVYLPDGSHVIMTNSRCSVLLGGLCLCNITGRIRLNPHWRPTVIRLLGSYC
jgi:hypothetical protein